MEGSFSEGNYEMKSTDTVQSVLAPAPPHNDELADNCPPKAEPTADAANIETATKKKKKKKGGASKQFVLEELNNSVFRCLNNWPATSTSKQTFPPTIPIHLAFPSLNYPEGEVTEYVGSNSFRATDSEKKSQEKLIEEDLKNIRRAAECHRQTRKYLQSYCRPGMKLVDLCQRLESKSKELIAASGLECGWGFPTGCSVNNVAAHYTPNYGDDTQLQFDFGVQVGGRIIDSAFTVAFDPKFDSLIKATQDGTNVGLRTAGIDVPFSEIGTAIHEAIESYEMEIDGKLIPILPVFNLNGHSIGPYKIHAGKSVPIVRNEQTTRMEEGEIYAIETFATTGKGRVIDSGECSHYMRDGEIGHVPLRLKSSKALLHAIDQNFGTLAFCRRWLDDLGQTRHQVALKSLVESQLVTPYPPLADVKGSFVSQMEHTVYLRPTCKEVLSRGPDY